MNDGAPAAGVEVFAAVGVFAVFVFDVVDVSAHAAMANTTIATAKKITGRA